ncbi:hypothetical protein QA635_33505 [Bradyrhizobium brasilense]|nr:hypothetical protein [Bradyrhizobium australafricanum]WFU37226.1 hypothetical protein QA635_33505 [Bradyrhizobium australafricanum]
MDLTQPFALAPIRKQHRFHRLGSKARRQMRTHTTKAAGLAHARESGELYDGWASREGQAD